MITMFTSMVNPILLGNKVGCDKMIFGRAYQAKGGVDT